MNRRVATTNQGEEIKIEKLNLGAVSNPIMYLLALVLGSVLGAILLIVSLNLGKKVEK